jgi:hypothetical protein
MTTRPIYDRGSAIEAHGDRNGRLCDAMREASIKRGLLLGAYDSEAVVTELAIRLVASGDVGERTSRRPYHSDRTLNSWGC